MKAKVDQEKALFYGCKINSLDVYRTLLLGVGLCFLWGTFAFAATNPTTTTLERRFLEGRYEKAVQEANALIDARSSKRDEVYYLKGLSLLRLGRNDDARSSFQNILSRYSRSSYAFDAAIGIGDAYFLQKRFDDAVRSYNEALGRFPNHKNTPALYYKLGKCYKEKGSDARASEYFTKVKKLAPLSFESRLIDDNDLKSDDVATPAEGAKGGGVYSVQVGYFKSRRNADNLAKKISGQGFTTYVDTVGDFYRTKVGHYSSKREATDAASRLKKLGYSTKICTGSYCSAE